MCELCEGLREYNKQDDYKQHIEPLVRKLYALCEALDIPFLFVAQTSLTHLEEGHTRGDTTSSVYLPGDTRMPYMSLMANIMQNSDGNMIHKLDLIMKSAMAHKTMEALPPAVHERIAELMRQAKDMGVDPDAELIGEILRDALAEAGMEDVVMDVIVPGAGEQSARFN